MLVVRITALGRKVSPFSLSVMFSCYESCLQCLILRLYFFHLYDMCFSSRWFLNALWSFKLLFSFYISTSLWILSWLCILWKRKGVVYDDLRYHTALSRDIREEVVSWCPPPSRLRWIKRIESSFRVLFFVKIVYAYGMTLITKPTFQ